MRRIITFPSLLALSLTATGCELVGDILEFGFWAIVVVGLIVAAVAWGLFRLIARMGGSGPAS